MSLICLCVTDINDQEEVLIYQDRLLGITKRHSRGVTFSIDWCEPIVETLKEGTMIINLVDSMDSDNCEMLLLPDGWYYGAHTNKFSFKQRMKFLYDVADVLLMDGHKAEFYIGLSGTNPDEFVEKTVRQDNFIDVLALTIGQAETDETQDYHIVVIP